MKSLKALLYDTTIQLNPYSASARLDAEILMCHVLQKPRSFIHTWPEHPVDDAQLKQFNELIARRFNGEPVAHLTGTREFWSLNLHVSSDTLIPRPETESLVEQALTHIPLDTPCKIADLGTGSGAIAIAIAHERPKAAIIAIDNSPAALTIAKQNAANHRLKNITFRLGHWMDSIDTTLNLIISNPPYIRSCDPHLQQDGLMFEPQSALVAAQNGLADIYQIATQARDHLRPGGWLLIEHGYDQQQAVIDCLQEFDYVSINGLQDLSGQDRMTECQQPD